MPSERAMGRIWREVREDGKNPREEAELNGNGNTVEENTTEQRCLCSYCGWKCQGCEDWGCSALYWSLRPGELNFLAAGSHGTLLWRCSGVSWREFSQAVSEVGQGAFWRGLVSWVISRQSFNTSNGEQRRKCGLMLASHLHVGWEPIRFWGTLATLYLGTSRAEWCKLEFSLDYGEKQTHVSASFRWQSISYCPRPLYNRDWGKKYFCHPGTANVPFFY